MPKDKATDDTSKGDNHDQITLKGSRTLESDIAQYKKRLEKYGAEEASSYDPYVDVKDEKALSNLEDKTQKDQKGEKVNGENEETGNISESLKERRSNENPDEVDIPFADLLKHKLKDLGEPAAIYSPQIPSAHPKITPYYPPSSRDIPAKHKAEPQIVAQITPSPQVKKQDLEGELREDVERLSREHAELKQKLEYYIKNKNKVFEEREDLLLKKNEIENVLKPLLTEERRLEDEIRKIERDEKSITHEEQKKDEEKKRWNKEDRRQQIEHDKWGQMDKLKEATKLFDDKSRIYETLLVKEKEAEVKLKEVQKEKEIKEAELRLLNIKKLKKDIEINKTKLALQIKSFEDSIKRLTEGENRILGEKFEIEENELKARGTSEEKLMEAKRWETEDKLRKVEQERWQISDKQKRLLEIMADISGQHSKIVKDENETLEKLNQLKTTD